MTSNNAYANNKLFILLCFLSVLCITFILVPITFQNDTFYTIKIGERIVQEGFTPIDNFTFLADLPYTYPHWLYDYSIFVIYQLGGFKAIYLSSIILTLILAGSLILISYRISQNRFVTFFVVCATVMTLAINFTARAQLITYILFVVEYGILYAYSQQKISRLPFFIAMMVISTLVVNMHCATWILYFLIAMPFVAEKIISHYLIHKPYPLSARIIAIPQTQYSAIFVLITLLLSILTGFLTPIGDTPFTYLIKTYRGITTLMISEHQPLAPISNIAFMIFILQMTYLLLFTRCKFFMSELLLLAGLCFLTLMSIRQSAILLLMNALIAPRLLTQAFEEQCPKRLVFYTTRIATIKGGIVALIIIVALCYASYFHSLSVSKITPFAKSDTELNTSANYDDHYPVKAMDYLILNADPTTARIYADYALGSYVLFKGFKPMVDSRADLYTIEFNNKQDYLKEIAKLISFQTHYEVFFSQFNINYILLAQNDSLNSYIKYEQKYQNIYEDEEFIIYKRE